MYDLKIGDRVKTTDKYNRGLSALHHWARLDEGEIIDFTNDSKAIAKINVIKGKNRRPIEYYGIAHIEKI